ncbi:hypothetical protein [Kordiimonas aquimaris]|nr:hypothetical protein [Kordiimonas aquimaris]
MFTNFIDGAATGTADLPEADRHVSKPTARSRRHRRRAERSRRHLIAA